MVGMAWTWRAGGRELRRALKSQQLAPSARCRRQDRRWGARHQLSTIACCVHPGAHGAPSPPAPAPCARLLPHRPRLPHPTPGGLRLQRPLPVAAGAAGCAAACGAPCLASRPGSLFVRCRGHLQAAGAPHSQLASLVNVAAAAVCPNPSISPTQTGTCFPPATLRPTSMRSPAPSVAAQYTCRMPRALTGATGTSAAPQSCKFKLPSFNCCTHECRACWLHAGNEGCCGAASALRPALKRPGAARSLPPSAPAALMCCASWCCQMALCCARCCRAGPPETPCLPMCCAMAPPSSRWERHGGLWAGWQDKVGQGFAARLSLDP